MAAVNMLLNRSFLSLGKVANPLIRVQLCNPSILVGAVKQLEIQHQQTRTTTDKTYNPKFRKYRAAKVIKFDLPEKDDGDMTPEETRSKMKEKGVDVRAHKYWSERVFFVSNTGAVIEPYVPPEGDGKLSAVTLQGAKQKFEFLEKKGKSMMAIRKIKSYDEDFKLEDFVEDALDVYKSAHEALMKTNKQKIEEFVTEKAYIEMTENAKYKTIVWKFHKSLSPPKVVHSRTTHVVDKANIFAQVTLRLHTQQSLCIYDRFGRVEFGDENLIKDVLEYVVFEKHISDQYGKWRLHHKIIPDWMPASEPIRRTFRKPEALPDLPEEKEKQKSDESEEEASKKSAVAA